MDIYLIQVLRLESRQTQDVKVNFLECVEGWIIDFHSIPDSDAEAVLARWRSKQCLPFDVQSKMLTP